MGSVYEEITRLETAKADIETAIEGCGVNVPDTDLISTYAQYIRQIPSAVFSELNVDSVGGEDMYIKSIEQKDGLINATVGGLVSSTNSGIVPKTGTKAAATINNQGNDWVLTTTSGEEPSWRKLPANAFKNDNTNTTYSLAGALSGNTFITTLTDSNSNKTIATIPCVTGASTSAAGKAGLVPAPAKNKLNQYLCSDGSWYDLNVKKYYSIDASELDITKFYPVIIAPSNIETDCEVHSPNLSGSSAYNQNVIHFILNSYGWTDTPKNFKMIHQGVYSTDEITIGAVGAGNENGSHCVWVRGGLVYRFYCNKEPKLKKEGYTSGNEVYSVGENYSGGTNNKVTIYWTYGDSSQLLTVKGDIPTKTSQLTNNSGFLTSRGYIGGTQVQANKSVQDLVGIKNIIGENSKEIIHTTDGYLEFGKGFSDVITWFNASQYKFKLGNTQAFIITTDGKVGIGDVGGAPKAKLHVAGGSVLADSYHAWSGGFSKEGCSNAHILLAGGGHKSVSDFAAASHSHSYLPLAGGQMNSTAYISWNSSDNGNDVADWKITGNGLRIISSTTTTSNAPTQYATALHVRGRYGFQLASQGGVGQNSFYIRNIANDNWNTLIHSGNIGSQSVNYATSAGNATNATNAVNADTVDNLHASDFVKITPKGFSQHKKGIWTKILTFTITKDSLNPSISFSWHPTECARAVWADFNINIRTGGIVFMGNWKGSSIRTLRCVGDGTTYDVWVSGTKDAYDPFGAIQITSRFMIKSYNTGSLAYQDSEPTGTYSANVSNTTIANYANSAGSVAWANVSGKPSFASVATSGSYTDLSNKPTIGNGTITINQAGKKIGSFSLNSTSNTTINLTDANTWRGITDSVSTTSSDISASATAVKSAYDKAVAAYNLANGKTANTGTVTSVTITQGTGITVSNSGTAITTRGTRTITLNSASSSAIGGVKLGYTESGANIPLKTSSDKGYVTLTKNAVVTALGYTPPTSDTNTNTTYSFTGGVDKFTVTPSSGSATDVGVQTLLVNGTYTSNGGEQRPNYVGSGKVRWNMMRSTTTYYDVAAFFGYCDWMMMDTYTGSDVPYVTMIGVLKAATPHAYIASGAKGSSTGKWTIKTLLDSDNSSVSKSGQTLTVKINGTTQSLTNTDSSVSQSSTTTSSFRPLVCGYTTSSTAGSSMETSVTNVVYVSNKFYAQPSTGFLYATGFSGNLVAGQTYAKTIRPETTTTHFLGSAEYRWNNVFSNKGNFSGQIISSVTDGTSPFSITSTTVNTNLNADMVDGKHASDFATSGHTHSAYYDSTISRAKNTVLAAPNGSNGSATFRSLVAADIPSLAASKITSGTFNAARIPGLAASKITSGTFAIARIPTGTTSSTVALGDHTHSAVNGYTIEVCTQTAYNQSSKDANTIYFVY